ncbi:MAG TPA: PEGA domain-containing protein, partial [Polyangiaceae bacterium]|nr:PEGA domain-containing protein [Polyangiaceae bacterium]
MSFALAAALGASVSFSRPALAQAEDQAAARSLFEEGRRLLKKGQYPEACEKLEAASKLYASSGILLNLGDCYDKLGKTASAWTEFGEAAATAARSRRNDQEGEARRRQAAEEPKLTRLKIHVATEVAGLAITRDGTPLASAAWGTAIPVDPGSHEIRAEAPGHESWSTSVTVSTQGQTVSVEVPELTVSPPSPAPPPQHDVESAAGSAGKPAETSPTEARSRTLDWVLVGGGAAVGIAGGVLWGIGSSNSFAAKNENSEATNAKAKSDYSSAQTLFY